MAQSVARRTAGALIHRPGELAIVHRPKYDDWTWPKGGVDTGEHVLQAAAREACEETGLAVALERTLGTTAYARPGGQTSVQWFSARCLPGAPGPTDGEVDEIRWLSPAAAAGVLSYPGDLLPLQRFMARPQADSMLLLVRHAKAGERASWELADGLRPLEAVGKAQAEGLARVLPVFAPTRIATANPVRCVETVAPLAAATGLDVAVDEAWGDEAWWHDPAASAEAIREFGAAGGCNVLCSQGSAIPDVVSRLAEASPFEAVRADVSGCSRKRVPRSRKGSTWVLSFREGDVFAADYLPL